jgi:hypothetical protein
LTLINISKLMRAIYLILSFATLFVFDFYLKANVVGIGEQGDYLNLLIIFIILGGLLFVWRASTSKSIIIHPSLFVLLAFLFYFNLRIIVDTGSLDKLRAYTVATSGGVILFYALGTIVSIIVNQHIKNSIKSKNYFTSYVYSFVIYLFLSLCLQLDLLYEFSTKLRIDIFLIEDMDGSYQRPGNFLVINYIVILYLYAHFSALKKISGNLTSQFTSVIVFFLFAFYTLISLLISQLIGSNSATVVIAGLGILVIAMLALLHIKSVIVYLSKKKIGFVKLALSKLLLRFCAFVFFVLAVLVVAILVGSNFLGIDLSMTRIGGFGSGEFSSVSSRLELLNNFTIHFSYSPFLGNMNVDCLTTSCGSYVHSLPAMLLTHTGLLGFFLFLTFIVIAFKERFIIRNMHIDILLLPVNILNTYLFFMFLFVLLISSAATALTWATLWFSMGLFLTGIEFINKSKFNVD